MKPRTTLRPATQVAAVLDGLDAELGSVGDMAAPQNQSLALALVAWHEWSFVRGGSVSPLET
jgi:hypothetical protein